MNNNEQQRVLGRILAQRQDSEDLAAIDAAGGTRTCETGGPAGDPPKSCYTRPGRPPSQDYTGVE